MDLSIIYRIHVMSARRSALLSCISPLHICLELLGLGVAKGGTRLSGSTVIPC